MSESDQPGLSFWSPVGRGLGKAAGDLAVSPGGGPGRRHLRPRSACGEHPWAQAPVPSCLWDLSLPALLLRCQPRASQPRLYLPGL